MFNSEMFGKESGSAKSGHESGKTPGNQGKFNYSKGKHVKEVVNIPGSETVEKFRPMQETIRFLVLLDEAKSEMVHLDCFKLIEKKMTYPVKPMISAFETKATKIFKDSKDGKILKVKKELEIIDETMRSREAQHYEQLFIDRRKVQRYLAEADKVLKKVDVKYPLSRFEAAAMKNYLGYESLSADELAEYSEAEKPFVCRFSVCTEIIPQDELIERVKHEREVKVDQFKRESGCSDAEFSMEVQREKVLTADLADLAVYYAKANDRVMELFKLKAEAESFEPETVEVTNLADKLYNTDYKQWEHDEKEYLRMFKHCMKVLHDYFNSSSLLPIREKLDVQGIHGAWELLIDTYAQIGADGFLNMDYYLDTMPFTDINKFARVCKIVYDIQKDHGLMDLPKARKLRPWKLAIQKKDGDLRYRFQFYFDKAEDMECNDWVKHIIIKENEHSSLEETVNNYKRISESNTKSREKIGKVETKESGKDKLNSGSTSRSNSSDLLTSTNTQKDYSGYKCGGCKQMGHIKKNCPHTKKETSETASRAVGDNSGLYSEENCWAKKNDNYSALPEKVAALSEKNVSLKKAVKKSKNEGARKLSWEDEDERNDRVDVEICYMNKVKIIGENTGIKFESVGSLIKDCKTQLREIQCEQLIGFDSCCTKTMTPNEEDLTEKKKSTVKVKFANQEKSQGTIIGKFGEIENSVLMEELEESLGYNALFDDHGFIVYKRDSGLIKYIGKRQHNLYYFINDIANGKEIGANMHLDVHLKLDDLIDDFVGSVITDKSFNYSRLLERLHLIMGHRSISAIKDMIRKNLIEGVGVSYADIKDKDIPTCRGSILCSSLLPCSGK
jgi:hypothetical protein